MGILGKLLSSEALGVLVRHVRIVSEDGDYASQIDNSGRLVTIDPDHHLIHQGKAFEAENLFSGVTNNSSVNMLFVTGAKAVHFRQFVGAEGSFLLRLFEAPTYSVAGTAVASTQRNRTSTTAALTTVTHTPTTSVDGTLLSLRHNGGGDGQNGSGGMSEASQEFVLKPSTAYLMRATNISGATKDCVLGANFYES